MRVKKFQDCAKVHTLPLHFAVINKMSPEIRRLVEGGTDVNATDHKRRTALMLCSMENDEPLAAGTARMLLQAGADTSMCDVNGRNALMFAVIFQRTLLVDLLLHASEYNMNKRDVDGKTALHYALLRGQPEIVYSVAKAFKNQYVGTDGVLKEKRELLWKAIMESGERISEKKESTFYNPSLPEKPWKRIIQSERESTRVHLSSSALNVHQFRRGPMRRFDVRSARRRRRQSFDDGPRSSSADLSCIMNLSARTPPVLRPRSSLAYVRRFNETGRTGPRRSESGTSNYSWRSSVPLFWDVFKEQCAPSYRPSANPVPQTYEEALGLPPRDMQPEVDDSTEGENTARSVKSYTSRRRRSSTSSLVSQAASSAATANPTRIADQGDEGNLQKAVTAPRGESDNSGKTSAKPSEKDKPESTARRESVPKWEGLQEQKSQNEQQQQQQQKPIQEQQKPIPNPEIEILSPSSSSSSSSLSARSDSIKLPKGQTTNARVGSARNRPGSAVRKPSLPSNDKQTQKSRLSIPQPGISNEEPEHTARSKESRSNKAKQDEKSSSLTEPKKTAGNHCVGDVTSTGSDGATPPPRDDAAKRGVRRPDSILFRNRVLSDILEENEAPTSPGSPDAGQAMLRKGGKTLRVMSAHVRGARANGRLSR